MAGTVNKAILIGRLGQDVKLAYTAGGVPVASFSMATDEGYKDKDGNKVERTEWHRIVAWQKLGELCNTYLRKGSKAYVEGRLQTRKWQDQNGQDKYTTEVVAREVTFLDAKGSNGQSGDPGPGGPPVGEYGGVEEVPF